jgi:predicted amidohydrolase
MESRRAGGWGAGEQGRMLRRFLTKNGNPARVLQSPVLDTLNPGTTADVTVLTWSDSPQTYRDALGETFTVPNQLVPAGVVKKGEFLRSHRRLVRDIPSSGAAVTHQPG